MQTADWSFTLLVDHSALLCIFDFHISFIHVAWWEGLHHWPWARLPGVQHGGGLGGYEVLRDEEEHLWQHWRSRGSNQDGHSTGYHGEKHSSEWMVLHRGVARIFNRGFFMVVRKARAQKFAATPTFRPHPLINDRHFCQSWKFVNDFCTEIQEKKAEEGDLS